MSTKSTKKKVKATCNKKKIYYWECLICHYKTSHKGNYRRHLKIHFNNQSFQCEFCTRKFKRSDNLKRHQRIHTNNKPYICFKCNSKFNTKSNCNRHVQNCRFDQQKRL